MSPEYDFYIKVNLVNEQEAEQFANALREVEGVEIVAATVPMDVLRNMSLGELLRFYRNQSGLSMNRFSWVSDLSVGTISRIEKGDLRSKIRDATAFKLIHGLGFKEDDPRTQLVLEKIEQANNLQGI
jgi:DNA-binding XRE family transcriptional regulator